MDNHSVKEPFECLERRINKLGEEFVNIFYGPNNIDKAHIWLYNACTELFGEDVILNDSGTSGLRFDESEFTILSFNSFRGVIKSNSDVGKAKQRYNLFKKGRLWSSKELHFGNNFYMFLNELTKVFKVNPVSTISAINYKSPQRKQCVKVSSGEEENAIYFPSPSYFENHESDLLQRHARIFKKYLAEDFLRSDNPSSVFAHDIEALSHAQSLIIKELINDAELSKTVSSVKRLFGFSDTLMARDDLDRKIRIAAFLYCYNHFPFDLFLYYPKIATLEEYERLTVVMIAKLPGTNISNDLHQIYCKLAQSCEKVADLEVRIVNRIKESTELQLKWELEYQNRLFFYKSFAGIVENICEYICRRDGIQAEIRSRVKTFQSFFNKIYKRANEGQTTKRGGVSYKELVQSLSNTESYFEVFFEDIKDIAGVRVICVYESDVEKFVNAFKTLGEEDLKCYDFKNCVQNTRDVDDPEHDSNEYNYRGSHLTVLPGDARLKLIEFKSFDKVRCEIQVRSILAHGWSNVQHPMEYKSSVPLKEIDERLHEMVKEELQKISKELKEQDKKLCDLKTEVGRLNIPMDKFRQR